MQYRRHDQPGCGGCLLLIAMLVLVIGGAPALLNFLGFLFFAFVGFILLLVALFWGITFYIKRQVSLYEKSQTETHNLFVYLLVTILVKIAEADGKISREEVNTIIDFFRSYLNYTQNQIFWVRELIREAKQSQTSLESLLSEFKTSFSYEPRLILIEMVYKVIFSKQPISDHEMDLARKIGAYLGIHPYDQEAILAKYMAMFSRLRVDEDRYYTILGLEPGADFEQIKTAYRKLSMKYHPDKVSHLGEEFLRVSEEKMKELNEAYQYLKKKFS